MRTRRRRGFMRSLVALLAAMTVLASGSLTAGAPAALSNHARSFVAPPTHALGSNVSLRVSSARDDLDRALLRGDITPAQHALQRALSLFQLGEVRSLFGEVIAPGPRDATLILRNLSAMLDDLEGKDLRRARTLQSRPDDGESDPAGVGYTASTVYHECTTHLCVHWVEETKDAPPLADSDGDDIPDWVERTARVLENAWKTEVGQFGFRAPKSDHTSTNHGPDRRLDVYLADVGSLGIYGFVQSDDPNLKQSSGYKFWDFSTYMVIDDDFASSQFFGVNGARALKVTVAHEFFHSVQGAYDWAEDGWLSEGTATWMEDQIYDGINDNHQYLRASPLRRPSVPLDVFGGGFQYGNFIFWQYVGERFALHSPAKSIRRIWRWADGSPQGPDLYSLRAVSRLAKSNGASLRKVFHGFGRCLLFPAVCYSEGGRGYARKGRVPVKSFILGPGQGRKRASAYRQDHLTTKYLSFEAGRNVSRGTRIRVRVDLPKLKKGPAASLVYRKGNNQLISLPIRLNRRGDGARSAPLGKVRRVFLVLSNAGSRFKCWKGTPLSCQGKPLDNNGVYAFRASLRG